MSNHRIGLKSFLIVIGLVGVGIGATGKWLSTRRVSAYVWIQTDQWCDWPAHAVDRLRGLDNAFTSEDSEGATLSFSKEGTFGERQLLLADAESLAMQFLREFPDLPVHNVRTAIRFEHTEPSALDRFAMDRDYSTLEEWTEHRIEGIERTGTRTGTGHTNLTK